jgi:tetratricopeptide (TPR) repeat protein
VYQAYVAFSEGLDQYVSADFVTALPNFVRAYAIDTTFVAPLLYASLCASNLGQFARSDSLLSVVARHRTELTEYQRSWLAYRLAFLAGDHTRALVAIRSAANLAPDSKASYNHAVTAFQAGRSAEALAVLTAIAPERGPMRGFLPYWDVLAAVHHAMGRYDLERTVGERERRLYPQRMFAFLPSLRALAVDGRLAEIDEVLGALESLPADPIGVQFGDVLREVAEELRAHGHNEEAHRMFMRAYDWYRMAEVAARPGTRVMDVRTDRAWSESVRYPLARIAYAMGRYDEVDSLISLLRQDTPNDPEVLGLRGVAEARRGRRQAGLAIADSLQMLRSKYQFGAVTLHRARIAAVLGDHSQAMARLRESFTEGASHDLWLHRDIDLAGLRLDPQFASLVAPSNQ